LPEPGVLAAEAMSELTEVLRELNGLMPALDAGDQAQTGLLVEALSLGNEVNESRFSCWFAGSQAPAWEPAMRFECFIHDKLYIGPTSLVWDSYYFVTLQLLNGA
jgi:hypothetical protein